MMVQVQEEEFNLEAAQSALRMGLRAIIRQPTVLSRWHDEFSARETHTSADIAWIPGAESMAMLSAMPVETRHGMLAQIGLTEDEHTLLQPVVEQLANKACATASRLVLALPHAAHTGALLSAPPRVPHQAWYMSVIEEPVIGSISVEDPLTLDIRQQALVEAQQTTLHARTLFQSIAPTKEDVEKALEMVQRTITTLNVANRQPSSRLLSLGVRCAKQLGDSPTRRALLAQGMAISQSDTVEWAALWVDYADMLAMDGDIVLAEQWLHRAADVFQTHGKTYEYAVTMGKIADILQQQGDIDEALRIRREEELPVYDRLGDVRSRAVTMGQIADIFQQQGHLDEALRMQQERLPMVVRIGDMVNHAHVLFSIAHLRLAMGQTDPAFVQEILANIWQSFGMFKKIHHAHGITYVGLFFGQLLAQLGQKEAAVAVLEQSETAFQLLKQAENAQQVHAMIEQIQHT